MKLSEIINLIDDASVVKDAEFTSLGLAVSKCNEKLLSFIESEKYIGGLSNNIECLITTADLAEALKDKFGVIVSKNPRMDYFKLHNKLTENKEYVREEFDTVIGENCKISDSASISKKNVIIGNNVKIEEFVVIRENTVIEDNAIIRSGVKIGGEGFEYKRADGTIMNVNHCGGVIIEKNVEVQYNACIDKALYTWDNTIVGMDTKIDNLVHLEHDVKVGRRCLIASSTVIGGRTIIGDDSWIGLGAVISNGLILGKKISVSLGSVVTKSLLDGEKVSGNFAINHNKYIEFIKSIR